MFKSFDWRSSGVLGALPRRLKAGIVAVTCGSLVAAGLSGCVTSRDTRIGADDGSDACRPYVVALDSTGDYFAEDMLKGAVAGAAVGALIGALASGGKDTGKAIAIGAAGGAVLGAAGGYWQSKQSQGRDQAVLGVNADLSQEAQQMDKTQLAFRKLTDCRRAEAAKIKKMYSAKSITREEAQRRLRVLSQQAQNDVAILANITGNMDKRLGEYQFAAAEIDPSIPAPTPGASAAAKAPSKGASVKKASTKASSSSSSTAQLYSSLQTKRSEIQATQVSYTAEAQGWQVSG